MTRTHRIGFVGAGFRTAAFLTAIRALPDEFEPVAALIRTDASAERLHAAQGFPTTTSFDRFLALGPFDVVVLAVPWPEVLPLAGRLLDAGQAVLSETPIAARTSLVAPFFERYGADAAIQSAEQYRFQPMHAARIAVARSGRIGRPVSVTASFAHDYHAMSVIRAVLGLGFERVRVTAAELGDLAVRPLGRAGWAERLEPEAADRVVATLGWPGQGVAAVHDFAGEQYFSPVRGRRLAIRGTHGELVDDRVVSIRVPGEPTTVPLVRTDAGVDGDLTGHGLRDVRLGDEVLWRSDVGPARLAEDELAVVAVLRAMRGFVDDGTPFYGVADAAEDQYLAELVRAAAEQGRTVESTPQAWSHLASSIRPVPLG